MNSGWKRCFGLPLAAACAMVVGLVGCGSDEPFGIVPVEGKITYEDGSPIPGVQLQFIPMAAPLDEKTFPRTGVAGMAEDGTIEEVTTYEYGDGLVPGQHKVIVKSQSGNGQRTKDVDVKYGREDTTPLTVDTADSPFEILIEKP